MILQFFEWITSTPCHIHAAMAYATAGCFTAAAHYSRKMYHSQGKLEGLREMKVINERAFAITLNELIKAEAKAGRIIIVEDRPE